MDREKHCVAESDSLELTIILDAYQISDSLTQAHLAQVGPVMCKKGCSNCCKNPTVPFTEPELIGILWYAIEKLKSPLRERVKQRLYAHQTSLECPFLVDDECSVYEMRPLICRQFYIKNKTCAPHEDIFTDRPDDIVAPIQSIAEASLLRLLDFWPRASSEDKQALLESGVIDDLTVNMHEYDWVELAKTMDAFDHYNQ